MDDSGTEWRLFYDRQAERFLKLAQGADPSTAEVLTAAAKYYLNKLDDRFHETSGYGTRGGFADS
jgi:hypothetical protein